MTLTAAPHPGFFGKLPVAGDFVSRRLPRQFIDSWDHWLKRGMAASRANLADSWPDAYLSSPVWRFALNPGIAGDSAWIGILLPSIDRVGRYFPLTIAAPIQNHKTIQHYFTSIGDWFEQIEQLALSGLNGELALNKFDGRLKSLVPDLSSVYRSGNYPIAENPSDLGKSTVRIDIDSIGLISSDFCLSGQEFIGIYWVTICLHAACGALRTRNASALRLVSVMACLPRGIQFDE